MPRFTTVVRKAETKHPRAAFWRKYGAGVLFVVLIACAVLYAGERPLPFPFKSGNPVGYAFAREVLAGEAVNNLTNKARAGHGLPSLRTNRLLNAIAESRAKDMLEKQYFAHVSPTGQEAADIARKVGYPYKIIAENIAEGDFSTNREMVDGWMQSPGHRKNILSREVEEIGVAVLKGKMHGNDLYIGVQIFGLQAPPVSKDPCVAPPKRLSDDIERGKAEMARLVDQSNRLRQDLDADREAIEAERRVADDDPKKVRDLNRKIGAYNQKSNRYNRIMADAKAKAAVLESRVREYNEMVEAYNDCRRSAK